MIKAPSNEEELELLLREIQYDALTREIKKILKLEVKELEISDAMFERIIELRIDEIRYCDIPLVIERLSCVFPKTALYLKSIVRRYENELKRKFS